MKIKKFNESYIPSNEEELIYYIEDIISNNVDMRQVIYGEEGEMEIDPKSRFNAAVEIVKELKKLVDFDLIFSTKKYNL